MRKINTIKNIKIGMICTLITLIFSFISRAIFVKVFGANIAGFNNLILNLMGFLNIAELGIGTAITYSLYKPIRNNDFESINEILYLFKYYYKKVAKFVLVFGIILSLFLNSFIKGQIPIVNAYIYYFMFLFNTIITYFYIYKQTLLIADQKQYIVVIFNNSIKLLKIIIQIIILFYIKSYFIWITIEIAFNYINLTFIDKKMYKIYKNIDFDIELNIKYIKEKNKQILKNMKKLFFHKIAGFIAYQTDSILISLFISLKETAIYGNYMMIINGVLSLLNTVMGSFTASVGDLVSEGDNKKSYAIFKKLYIIDHYVAIIITFILYKVMNQFILIWVGKEYLFVQGIVFLLSINIYMQIIRSSIDKFKDSYGIFWDSAAPVVEGVINLSISYILIKKIGVMGLFIGTIISNIVILLIWKPYVVYKYGFKLSEKIYIKLFLKMIIIAGFSLSISDKILNCILQKIIIENIIINFVIELSITGLLIVGVTSIILIFLKDFREILIILFSKKIRIGNK